MKPSHETDSKLDKEQQRRLLFDDYIPRVMQCRL